MVVHYVHLKAASVGQRILGLSSASTHPSRIVQQPG